MRSKPSQAGVRRQARAATVALLAAAVVAACSSHAPEAANQRTPVRAEVATTGPATRPIVTNGTVATKDEMRLSFKVAGVIKAIYVEEGQAVRRGQRLAEIELTEINAQVEQARALAEKAQRDLARGERLYADEVISLEQLQDLRTQAAMQKAALRSTEFNRGYSVITAQSDGVVLRKLAQERELVPAGQAVLVVGAHTRGYIVRAALSDRELVQLKLGDAANIRLDAYPGQELPGTLTEIASAADEKSGMFPIEVRIDVAPPDPPKPNAPKPNAPHASAPATPRPLALASGLVAKLRLQPATGRSQDLTYVPVSSVIEGNGDRASVFVVEGNTARRREVRVAFIESSGIALADGVRPGERVVTEGALYLADNDPVDIVQDDTRVREATKVQDNTHVAETARTSP